MSSPQLENGFTRVANEILMAAVTAPLNASQYAIILCVWRYTYGFNRKDCPLSVSFIRKATGLCEKGIRNEVKNLIRRNVLIVTEDYTMSAPRRLAFQKDYAKWQVSFRNVSPAPEAEEQIYPSPEECAYRSAAICEYPSAEAPEYRQERNLKENIKTVMCRNDFIERNKPYEEFNAFRAAYPRRQAKHDALKAFSKLKPDKDLLT
ncbi:MAG: replication protein [Eubacteriales bacterium]|nr:replication protein [Eubacteriales bacterium]